MEFLVQHFNAATVGTMTLLLFFYYYLVNKSRASNKLKQPPQLPGAWPIIGHFHLLAGSQLPHITLGALADKFGPIFTFRIGLKRALVVSSPEVAKEIFSDHDMIITSRPPLVAAKHLAYNYAMFPFTPAHGQYWRETRKASVLELLSNRALELHKHIMIEEVETFLKMLYQKIKNSTKDCRVYEVDFKQWFGELNLNVILRMVAGKKYFGDGGDDKEGRRCLRAVGEQFHYWGTLVLRDAVPFLGWLDMGGHEKAMKRTMKELDDIVEGWLEEHKRKWESEDEPKGEKDFMDAMQSALSGQSLAGYDADTINKATSLSMVAGGAETTTVALTWALALLLKNRDKLKKAQEELDRHAGKDRMVKLTDISKLVYIQAIVKETLRLYPPASIPAPRQFAEDCLIGGYFIPKGTWLILNLNKIQTDPSVWTDPTEFKPERFLTSHKNVDVRGLNPELTPFGAGRRACPAMSYSLQMVCLTLASLVHAFDLSTPNASIDMAQSSGLTNIKLAPLPVLISPRLPPGCLE